MLECPICQTEYTEGELSCCFVCDWDLTPCPEAFVERQNVHIAWAREIWIKFQALQQQLPTSINADIDANPQLSQLREESNLDAWNLLVSWVSSVNLNAANATVIRLQQRYQGKQPREIAHILIVQKSCQAAGVDLVRGIPGAAAILKGLAKVNLPTIAKLSAEMIYQIAAIYGVDLQASERQLEVLATFGAALLGEQAIEAGIDWLKCGIIPGKVISAGAKGLMIYAIGKAACLFYEAKVNQHVNPLISREVFDELREESQDYLVDATSEDAIVALISVEIETTPIKVPPPKPVKKPKVQHRTSGGAASLRGYFVLPELIEQGMQQRLGRGGINSMIFLNNELLVVCATGGAALFNLNSGEALWEIDCPAECGAINRDGTVLALGWKENIYLWDLYSGRLLRQFQGHTKYVSSVAISANGKIIASGSWDRTVRLWDVTRGGELLQLQGPQGFWSESLAISADGKLLTFENEDGALQLWDVASGIELLQLPIHSSKTGLTSAAFSPDGKIVAFSSHEIMQLWDIATGTELGHPLEHKSSVWSMAFSPNGKLLASGSNDNTVRLWNITSGTEVLQLLGHEDFVNSVTFSPDGKLVASGSGNWLLGGSAGDSTVRLWDVTSGTEIGQLQEHTQLVHSVAFHPDGKLVASNSYGRTVRLWDVASGTEVQRIQEDTELGRTIAFSPDGKLIALARSNDKTVWLWDVVNSTKVRQLYEHEGFVEHGVFSPDGRLVASRGADDSLHLWDVVTGRAVWRIKTGYIVAILAFSSDGKLVTSSINDNILRLWSVATGTERQQLRGHTSSLRSVAFSPDGKLLASGSGDETLRLWDVSNGREVRQLYGHRSSVGSLAFSPDGKLLASGSKDETVQLWDVASGREIRQLHGHASGSKGIDYVVFSPDGKLLASASYDGVVRLWKVKV